MTSDELTIAMHDVIDGVATADEERAVRARVASDPQAADEFAAWQSLLRQLSGLPAVHPPEGLVAAISTAIPDAAVRVVPAQKRQLFTHDQLSSDGSVIRAGTTRTTRQSFGFRTLSGWFVPAASRESNHMNTQRKVIAGGAVAVVALGLAVILTSFPPKSEDVVGTVVPAERYRAPQAGAEAVKLGDQTAGSSTSGGVDVAGTAAANVEADARANLSALQARANALAADRAAYQVQADHAAGADKIALQQKADKAAADRAVVNQQAEMLADKMAHARADNAAAASADKMANARADNAAAATADKMANARADNAAAATADKMANARADNAAAATADKMANARADNAAAATADKMANARAENAAAATADKMANARAQNAAAATADKSMSQMKAENAAAQAQADRAANAQSR